MKALIQQQQRNEKLDHSILRCLVDIKQYMSNELPKIYEIIDDGDQRLDDEDFLRSVYEFAVKTRDVINLSIRETEKIAKIREAALRQFLLKDAREKRLLNFIANQQIEMLSIAERYVSCNIITLLECN